MASDLSTNDMKPFKLLTSSAHSHGPRLGRLSLPNRDIVETPHYLAISSRGVVPHLSQDNFKYHTQIKGAYLGLEDFIESASRRAPPVLKLAPENGKSPLKTFTALPNQTISCLAPRRVPSVKPPNPSRKSEQAPNRSIVISTSMGFQPLDVDEYIEDVRFLEPDLAVAMCDSVGGEDLGRKRMEKMVDRTTGWTRRLLNQTSTLGDGGEDNSLHVLAPVLAIPCNSQSQYLNDLQDSDYSSLIGLALYDSACALDLPLGLGRLLRLTMDEPSTPHKVLDEIARGIDLFALPFIGVATDAGLALNFSFSPQKDASNNGSNSNQKPLAIDMWSKDHAIDLSPLHQNCPCYTCATHHRAYIHHLLEAKEMLAWVLLQIHNHQVIDQFFEEVRTSIASRNFEQDADAFQKAYESEFPKATGMGPRLRGYQMKSEGPGEPKKNPIAYNTLDDVRERIADAPIAPSQAQKRATWRNKALVSSEYQNQMN
ncbi:MAG: hypothetical protein M1820_007601 [Bogoriella megaspora]|nr:MAG: hypothetical protein M1820_007601 [Bogoriella megaspora]